MSEPRDDLSDLLSPHPAELSPTFREAVLRRTEGRLSRARWMHRGARGAAVAGVFLVGGLAGWVARPERERTIELPGAVHTVVVPVPVPVAERSHNVLAESPISASTAELAAEQQDDPNAAARLYRDAGDAFLRDQDYFNATRCYRLYLTRAGDTALTLDSTDSWLLVSLKNAAFREKIDVTKNDG